MKKESLVILSGPLKGTQFELDGSATIGRNTDNTIHLEDLQISRRHAVIEQTKNGTFVRDLGSGNGTYIGDRRVLEYRLNDGDIIRVGTIEIRFEGVEPEAFIDFQSNPPAEEGRMEASDAANMYETFFESSEQAAAQKGEEQNAQSRLAAVYKANQIISSEQDLSKIFDRVMDQIFNLVPAHNGVILLRDEKSGNLVAKYTKSDGGEAPISSTIVARAFDNGEAIITFDAADDSRFESGASIIAQNISSAMCTPLTHQDERLGVIYVDTRGTTNAFVKGDLELLVALAGPAAIAIRNAQYLQRLERSYQDTLNAIANSVEMRDHYTVGHTWRVTNFAVEVAKKLGWSEEKLQDCKMGGVLHDVGKIAVDDSILRKPGKLSKDEFAKMKIHPERGARMLRDIERLKPLIPYCLYHHERFDGKGYPFGLAGENIPLEGRVIAVADAFDAMTSNRPYRKALDPAEAIEEIKTCKGTQFDPAVADAIIACYEEGTITRVIQDFLKDGESIACPFCSTFISIPEKADIGDNFECQVCHRGVKLQEINGAHFGELLPQNE